MKSIVQIIMALTVLLLFAVPAQSAQKWELDKAHSSFYFNVDHIFSKTHGQFNDFKTEISFDPNNLGESSFYFEIAVKSINTNITKRDKHLQSGDFFDAGKYPLMTFRSKSITDAGNGMYQVAGDFTVKDVTYDLTIPIQLVGVKEHPTAKGKLVAGFDGRVTLDRLAYKVGSGKFYELGVIGKDVDVLVSLEVLADK
ncbi:MAG: polyisoprenoid-binding protein [Desulfobulbaceae bacterium]|nr:MAG: polyisoprenoid-binding protein [Desulfobulbaceae bacterium]